ncbi:MAG: hypothetical protein DIZ80_01120 [endosymbiont of Galathealinum brachiosum]|uniref:Uncharacterized protein n=1 Tax=endosymbiont of Galathealinum brachiosum TaxID=2200906 RepID=A0A370DNF7_9GAMM|nr:MAG: hypothetical protein DIZ80_01120 [endosymbiont of Galathealinum brachiosum]
MKFDISPEDIKKARVPHEVFLTNLIFNHVLVFVAVMSASSLTHLIVVIPIFSVVSLVYLFWGAQRAKTRASWYVNGHWQIAARRSRFFLLMLTVVGSLLGIIYMIAGGDMKPQHWAFGGATFLPVMVSVLGLIIFESESLHQAKNAMLPDWVSERFPENAPTPISE